MRKILHALVAVLLLWGNALYAQQKNISGVVTSTQDKTPLAGVTVKVKGSNTGTQTDASGKFTIAAKPGDVIQFSYVGYEIIEEKVTSSTSTMSISLASKDVALEEVVVTAMDIKRNPRELGYSAQSLGGKEIAETQRENFLNGLQGRAAGLTITPSSGTAGASSSIVLRGFNSLSLSNEPLFVVDGIIMDNQTVNETSNGGQGVGLASDRPNRNNDYTNRIADLNPNDIETITILKGPEATALYGSQASSGAIVITTKKAKSNKLAVQYDNNFKFQRITRFPEFIDKYTNGTNGSESNIFRYFGPAIPEGTKLYDNIHNFFRTGKTQTHNLGVDFGVKNSVFRFSASYLDQEGVVPNNDYKKINLRLSNTTKIGKMVELIPSISFVRSENKKVLRSAGGYMLSLLIWPNENDIRQFVDANGSKLPLFNANANADYDNPFFNTTYNKSEDETNRYTASLGINITPYEWLTLAGRFGYDTYESEGFTLYHPQSYFISAALNGQLDNYWRKYKGYNHTITATARKKIGDFSGRVMVGTMWQDYETQMFAIVGNKLTSPTSTDSSNTDPTTRVRLLRNNFGEYNQLIIRQMAYFGEAAISYKNMIFLNYTHRFEQASTLPSKNRNYNYPGASLSVIMSDILPGIKKGAISYWKLRTSLASTARLNSPYSTQSVFVNNFASGGGFSYGFTNNNPDLAPEKQKTYEIGTEFKLFKSKLGIDVAYYNTLNEGQIIENFRLSYGTGYVLNTQNAGSTRNQGVEVTLDAAVLNTSDWGWNIRLNFNKMWNEVVQLPKNVAEYYIADTWLYGNARGGITLNGPTTSITSYGYARNNAGQILINPLNGFPVIDATFKVRGDRNPDFTVGTINNLRYKNWRFSFLWDLKVGGDIFNATQMFLTTSGRSFLTEDRFTPRVIEGVLNDGKQNTANPTKNTIAVLPAYNDAYYTSTGAWPEEAFIQKDVHWFRLRDVSISYSFPNNMISKIKGLKSLGFFLTGNDLILITNYKGADPAVNGVSAASRGVGAFGFDYGTLPTPVSYNFGIRAGF